MVYTTFSSSISRGDIKIGYYWCPSCPNHTGYLRVLYAYKNTVYIKCAVVESYLTYSRRNTSLRPGASGDLVERRKAAFLLFPNAGQIARLR